jgi:hypothetical protein
MRAAAFAVCAVLACACGKKSPEQTPRPVPASAPAAASVAPAASAARTSDVWTGTYLAKAVDADAGQLATGPGTLSMTVARGRVTGEGKGALGPLLLSGVLEGGTLRVGLLPVDPNAAQAMTGVLVATIAAGNGSAARGTLRVSNGDARLVREASVELERTR